MASRDFFIHQNYVLMDRGYPFLKGVGSLENKFLGDNLSAIGKPIFVCGLARSGTSVVTQMLQTHPDLGSLLYKDLPMLAMPYFWSFVSDWYYRGVKPHQRPHKDGLKIDPNTPDAFEEFLWRKELDDYQKDQLSTWLGADFADPSLEQCLKSIIPKVVFIRKAKRYLSKGNYNLFRIQYLASLFPDSQFVLCFRNPFDHAHSLARVHALFSTQENKYAGDQMAILGHYEFGPQRQALGDKKAQEKAWKAGADYEGYLYQWLEVYQGVYDHYLSDKILRKRILLFDNEALVRSPQKRLQELFKFCDLSVTPSNIKKLSEKVHQRNVYKASEKIPEKLKKDVEALYKKLKSHL
ncbi:MAG TPA: sulfotransferase [Candidatus Gracilibacteria bacterium]